VKDGSDSLVVDIKGDLVKLRLLYFVLIARCDPREIQSKETNSCKR
jgi:hypothetical protein